jgi:glycosyltransferase involved in cell wall biosynthesis
MNQTKVALHDYKSHPHLPQKDGVNHAHEEIATLLLRSDHPDLDIKWHDFPRLLADLSYARTVLSDCDCVISNVGPHAHFYFYLREQLGLNYRIIRDVRTALWSSYLLQESLIAPLCRSVDTLLVATNFTHGIFLKIFPHLALSKVIRCYPLVAHFPADYQGKVVSLKSDAFAVGYLGRISTDKGFLELLRAVIALNSEPNASRRYRLLACGSIGDSQFSESGIKSLFIQQGVDPSLYTYLGSVGRTQIWERMKLFDLLVFPTVSSLETLGRVILEASYMGLPILASEHAAGTELLERKECLMEVDYFHEKVFYSHFNHKIGSVSVSSIVNGIKSHSLRPSGCWRLYKDDYIILNHAIHGLLPSSPLVLSAQQSGFIDRLRIDIPRHWDRAGSLVEIGNLVPVFSVLNDKRDLSATSNLRDLLLASTISLEKTLAYFRSRHSQYDFTDVGGIDIEVCNLLGYHPVFTV